MSLEDSNRTDNQGVGMWEVASVALEVGGHFDDQSSKWVTEYRIILRTPDGAREEAVKRKADTFNVLYAKLNKLGGQGWELVDITTHNDSAHTLPPSSAKVADWYVSVMAWLKRQHTA